MTEDSSTSTSRRRRPRVLLGITGSVAAVKGPELAVRLALLNADVRILLTSAGKNFWDKSKDYDEVHWNQLMKDFIVENPELLSLGRATDRLTTEPGKVLIHTAEEEWRDWSRLGDPVMHIELRDWADVVVIAPLSAHTLGKLAHGLCDDTLSCVMRAWDYGHGTTTRPPKPIVLAPAMNTAMWEHPLTARQLETIQSFWNRKKYPENGIHIMVPQVKELACGEVGTGALASVDDIVQAIKSCCANLR